MGEKKKPTKFWYEKLKETDYSKDERVGGRILLK
jgi:hypothetical protein